MFKFLKQNKKQTDIPEENIMAMSNEDFLKEHEYKMEHDSEYKKSLERSAAFFKADNAARKSSGLENKIGTYTFTCPNCGTLCKGEWVRFDSMGNLHGRTDCFTCDIHLMV